MTPTFFSRVIPALMLLAVWVHPGAAAPVPVPPSGVAQPAGKISAGVFSASPGVPSPPAGLARGAGSSLSNVVLTLKTLATLPGPTLSGLTLGGDGNFYGVTESGGDFNQGTVFQATLAGSLTILHSFTGSGDGADPVAGLILGADGSLYGTASSGGDASLDPAGAGTVFKITGSGVFTLLYSFTGGADGDTPSAPLVQGANGAFYGATKYGGDDGYGVAFVMSSGGALAALYSFDFTTTDTGFVFDNGASPVAALVPGTNGSFYGTTQSGGANALGTVFDLTPAGALATLDSFTAASGSAGPGLPGPQLVLGPDGNFYGTTFNGGANANGSVFQLTPAGAISTFYSFTGGGDGGNPAGGLLAGADGNFYGTTCHGGAYNARDPAGRGYGTLFQLTPAGSLTNLYSFTGGADGGVPTSTLIQGDGDGFYGTTATTVFGLTLTTLPSITTQPANQSVAPGGAATLSVSAGGSAPLGYQWQFEGTNLPGANSASLVLTNAEPAQAGYYSVVVSNTGGSTNSAIVLLSVTGPPAITAQPLGEAVPAGATVNFNVTAVGTPPLTYQWRLNGTNLAGAVGASLTLTKISLPQAGNYSVVAADTFGSVTSSNALLTVNNVAPSISKQPASLIAGVGQSASFTVMAVGSPPLGYQWEFNGSAIPQATESTLALPGVVSGQAGLYTVVVTNGFGSVGSSGALLTVVSAPEFLAQPTGGVHSVTAPANVAFSASAVGAIPLSYQWMFNGAGLPGATNSTYTLTNAASTQSGNYTIAVGNTFGSVTSAPPVLLLVEGAYMVTTLAGRAGAAGTNDGAGANARFTLPYAVAADPAGNVYVADTDNQTIRKITPNGLVTTVAGRAGSTGSSNGAGANARFTAPEGLAVDPAGNLYVADTGNQLIRKLTPAGVVTTIAGVAGAGGSTDGSSNVARFSQPIGLALDSSNNLYVADSGNDTIRKITPAGLVSTLAGAARAPAFADGASNVARFNQPVGIALDSSRNIYVSDYGNSTIRKITPSGLVSTLAGRALNQGSTDALGTNARFAFPGGIAIDAAGNLYVSDSNNHVVRMVTTAGATTTLAGLPTGSGGTDGLGSAAKFSAPEGIAVDGSGALYVADTSNQAIRKAFPLASVVPPGFASQPASQTVTAGSVVSFAPVLTGSTPLSFQWQFAKKNLASATGPALSLTNVQAAQAGLYTLIVTNLAGTTTSSNALLTLTAPVQGEVLSPVWAADVFSVSISTMQGHTYTLEYKDDLTLPSWAFAQVVAGNGGVMVLTDPGAAFATRYYRVVIQ